MRFSSSSRLPQATVCLLLMLLGFASVAWGQADVQGQWSTLNYSMTINPIHTALMHNGKILVIAGSGNCPPSQSGCPSGPPYNGSNHSGAVVVDPVAQEHYAAVGKSWDMFCNSMTVLAGRAGDGRRWAPSPMIRFTESKRPVCSIRLQTPLRPYRAWPMAAGIRQSLCSATAGSWLSRATDESGPTNHTVEIYTEGSGWSPPVAAGWTPPLYPRLHLLPNGNVFYSGSTPASYDVQSVQHRPGPP